jgi:lysine-specific demethylase/histidyl-hydroxylase NO66
MVDTACDQIGKRFLADRIPPALTAMEASLTHEGNPQAKITAKTSCRLVRPGIARLVLEDDKAVLYHCVSNSCVFHGHHLEPLEFEMDDAAALEQLLTTVEPHWIMVKDLFHDEIEEKIEIAKALFTEGILAVRNNQ